MIQGWKKDPTIVDVLAEAGCATSSPRPVTQRCSPGVCTLRE
jgi:hypothetical protein